MDKYKIIIVEDNKTERDVLAKYLEGKGYSVDKFENSDGVIEKIKSQKFDLALLDIKIERTEGIKIDEGLVLAEDIRKLEDSKQIQPIGIFFITVLGNNDFVKRAINICRVDSFFIKKPYDIEMLLQKISDYFKEKEDPVIKSFQEWIKTINPDDFTVEKLENNGKIILLNAEQILTEMILKTEFGINFKKSILNVTNEILLSSSKKKE